MEIGKYELFEELGRGGYGIVYRALDTILKVERAIKVLHPVLAADIDFIERFKREACFAAQLEHPHIVPVYEMDEENGRYYLVMKYMAGRSLKEILEQVERLSFEKAQNITRQVGEALDYAHRQELIHRDVKPGNILLGENVSDAVRLTDFGFAKAMQSASSASLSRTGGIVGTPAYMAPELWSGMQTSPATDIYSLACVHYEMLIGKALFPGETSPELIKQHIMDHPHYPEEWPEDVPEGIEEVLNRALAKEPQDRYANTDEFLDALQSLIKETPPADEGVAAELYDETTEQPCEKCGKTYAINLEKCPHCGFKKPVNPERKSKSNPVNSIVIFVFSIIIIILITLLGNVNNNVQQYENRLDYLSKKIELMEEYYKNEDGNYKPEIESYSATLETIENTATVEAKAHETKTVLDKNDTLPLLVEEKFVEIESGPSSGYIVHHEDGKLDTILLSDSITDFKLEGSFENPFSSSQHPWDFGILFRDYGKNDQYRLVIVSDGYWYFQNVTGDSNVPPLKEDIINNLNTGADESNKIKLVCQGKHGWFYINDIFVSELDLFHRSKSGQIVIATSMEAGDSLERERTGYHNMTVWSMDNAQEPTPDS